MSITPLQPGTQAPEFHLPNDRREITHSHDYLGQWLLVWWQPQAIAKLCAPCGKKIVGAVENFERRNIAILGITMLTVEENIERAMFVFDNAFPVLSADWGTADAWGAARPKSSLFAEVPHSLSYLIDPEGIIRSSWIVGGEHTHRPHQDEVILTYDALVGAGV